MGKKKPDKTKALLDIFAIAIVPLGILLLLVGAAAGTNVAILSFLTVGVTLVALAIFSILRRRNKW